MLFFFQFKQRFTKDKADDEDGNISFLRNRGTELQSGRFGATRR